MDENDVFAKKSPQKSLINLSEIAFKQNSGVLQYINHIFHRFLPMEWSVPLVFSHGTFLGFTVKNGCKKQKH